MTDTIDERTTGTPLKDIPGDAGPPVLGYTWQFIRGHLATDRTMYDKYGPVSWFNALGKTWVRAFGPDACGEVLANRDRAFDAGPGWGFLIGPFFRRGLMLLDGQEHHRHRRIMQEAFTADRLAGYLEPLNETVAAGIARWPTGTELRFYPTVKQLTLDVATDTFMGTAPDPAEARRLNGAFVDAVRAGTAAVRVPVPGLRWQKGLTGRRVLEQYLLPRVAEKRDGAGSDLFSALCHARSDDGDTFTDDDVVAHMIFLLMAAHDTATITLSTMAYYLAKHPEWQERCRAESQALADDRVAYDELDRLETLDHVMKESLRLVVPVPGVFRRANKETELLGYRIPAQSLVNVHLMGVHHMREYWPDPERFDPGRFDEDRREDKSHRNAFMPFGNGVHKCIGMFFGGMEVKATMHQLLRRYRICVPDGYTMPLDWTSLPRPSDGLPVTLQTL